MHGMNIKIIEFDNLGVSVKINAVSTQESR